MYHFFFHDNMLFTKNHLNTVVSEYSNNLVPYIKVPWHMSKIPEFTETLPQDVFIKVGSAFGEDKLLIFNNNNNTISG